MLKEIFLINKKKCSKILMISVLILLKFGIQNYFSLKPSYSNLLINIK